MSDQVATWGSDADQTEARIVTEMYGSVTATVHEYLRDQGVTPSEWQLLISSFGPSGHNAACRWIARHQTDAGRYDSIRSEQALARK